jgi:hypothetical protein
MRNTRVKTTVDGRPGTVYMFQKDCVVVGSTPFDDLPLVSEQTLPSVFSVTHDGDCFETRKKKNYIRV